MNRLVFLLFFMHLGAPLAQEASPVDEDKVLLDQLEMLNRSGSIDKFEVYIYNPSGRRDPFKKPSMAIRGIRKAEPDDNVKSGLEGFDIEAYEVTSILWDTKSPKALVKDPAGETHLVEKGVRIGRRDGYVAEIREGELIIVQKEVLNEKESSKPVFRTQVLKIGR